MYIIGDDEFPKEHLFELENNPDHLGRVIIYALKESFSVEIDIIVKESHKIFFHVDTLYNQKEERDALESAVQKLSSFLVGKKRTKDI